MRESSGALFNTDDILAVSGYVARGENSARQLLETMAKLLATYCIPLLRGDEGAWSRLVTQRDADAAPRRDAAPR